MATEILMPALSPTMEEGTLAKWLVKEGDTVVDDQPMVEVMTDKATVEITAPTPGVIADIRAEEGEVVPVGQMKLLLSVIVWLPE